MASSRAVLAIRNYFTGFAFTNQKCNTTPTQCQPFNTDNSQDLLKKPMSDNKSTSGFHTESSDTVLYDWRNAALVVVGACKGIGAHILRMALNEGVESVTNLDINEKAGFAMQYEFNQRYSDKNKVKFIKCDITSEHRQIEIFQNLLNDRTKTYVVVNNAGLIDQRPDMSKEVVDCNVDALVTSTLKALDLMRKDEGGSGGAIINLSPVSVLCHLPYTRCYNDNKKCFLTFNMSLGNEAFFPRTGVRVMSVCYGASDEGLIPIVHAKNKEEIENTLGTEKSLQMRKKAAAEAVIEIYKTGKSVTIWLSKEMKPVEDITYFVKNTYSDIIY